MFICLKRSFLNSLPDKWATGCPFILVGLQDFLGRPRLAKVLAEGQDRQVLGAKYMPRYQEKTNYEKIKIEMLAMKR